MDENTGMQEIVFLTVGSVKSFVEVIRCWRHRGCRGPVAIASVPVRKSGAGVKLGFNFSGTLKFIEKTVKKIAYGFDLSSEIVMEMWSVLVEERSIMLWNPFRLKLLHV